MIVRELIFTDSDKRFRVMIAEEPVKTMFQLCSAANWSGDRRYPHGGLLRRLTHRVR